MSLPRRMDAGCCLLLVMWTAMPNHFVPGSDGLVELAAVATWWAGMVR